MEPKAFKIFEITHSKKLSAPKQTTQKNQAAGADVTSIYIFHKPADQQQEKHKTSNQRTSIVLISSELIFAVK